MVAYGAKGGSPSDATLEDNLAATSAYTVLTSISGPRRVVGVDARGCAR